MDISPCREGAQQVVSMHEIVGAGIRAVRLTPVVVGSNQTTVKNDRQRVRFRYRNHVHHPYWLCYKCSCKSAQNHICRLIYEIIYNCIHTVHKLKQHSNNDWHKFVINPNFTNTIFLNTRVMAHPEVQNLSRFRPRINILSKNHYNPIVARARKVTHPKSSKKHDQTNFRGHQFEHYISLGLGGCLLDHSGNH